MLAAAWEGAGLGDGAGADGATGAGVGRAATGGAGCGAGCGAGEGARAGLGSGWGATALGAAGTGVRISVSVLGASALVRSAAIAFSGAVVSSIAFCGSCTSFMKGMAPMPLSITISVGPPIITRCSTLSRRTRTSLRRASTAVASRTCKRGWRFLPPRMKGEDPPRRRMIHKMIAKARSAAPTPTTATMRLLP